jgi:hypothetical protein
MKVGGGGAGDRFQACASSGGEMALAVGVDGMYFLVLAISI